MVSINKRKILLALLFGLYSISNIFVYLKTSYTYQVKQIRYLYELLNETNTNYDILYQKYALLNKKYDGLNQEIDNLNHKLDALKNMSKECEKMECKEKKENDIKIVSINDNDFIERICLDYEKVDADMSPLKYNADDTNPNNTIVKMFYTFF